MSEQPNLPPLDDQQVLRYLRQHPEFFNRHPELLTEISLPHPETGQAVSLIERQIAILREQKAALDRKLRGLTATARSNENLFERIAALILGLIDASAVEEVLERLYESLRQDFHADAIELHLFEAGVANTPLHELFAGVLEGRQPRCGHFSTPQRQALFTRQGEAIASATVIPLHGREGQPLGLLGIGSIDERRFHPEMGTAFLSHLGAVLSGLLLKVHGQDGR